MAKSLPPLNSVRVFECAARHLSFVRAAEELGVTQSAVSKQIATLEDFTGSQLFERLAGGLTLTLEGRELQQAVTPAFGILAESFRRYERRSPNSTKFRLATVASFAAQFLVPRLFSFETRFPNVNLEILTSDRILDLEREDVDLSIRYGSGGWEGLICKELSSAELIPVCAPKLHFQGDQDIERLVLSERRIQVFLKNEWSAWAAKTGVSLDTAAPAFFMEHFLVALRAVLLEQGLALLPEIVVRDHLMNGDLVQFSPAIAWHQAFHLVYRPEVERQSTVRDVVSWLLAAADGKG